MAAEENLPVAEKCITLVWWVERWLGRLLTVPRMLGLMALTDGSHPGCPAWPNGMGSPLACSPR